MAEADSPTFTELQMGVPNEHGTGFNLSGWGTWARHGVSVGFRVRLDERNRLVMTKLEIDAPTVPGTISSTMLREFPMSELLMTVREWIVSDGEPDKLFSETAAHDVWRERRADVVRALPGVADGSPPGRKTKRDDDYLRSVATEYVRLDQAGVRSPRESLVSAFSVGLAGIASTLGLARDREWLARPSGKGARNEIAPGPRLIATWEVDGYPDWYASRVATPSSKPTTATPTAKRGAKHAPRSKRKP